MRKITCVLLCVFISTSTLTGCGTSQEVTPFLKQETVILASSNQESKEEQTFSESQKVTNENILLNSTKFINEFAGLSPFADISSIDKPWIVRKYHTFCATDSFDREFYNKYNCDYYTKLTEIEKMAKQNINPNITMNENDDFSSCDGSERFNPLWIKEEQLFGWNASGGFSNFFRAYPLETYDVNGKYHIKAIDLYLTFEQEYFEGTPNGAVYAIIADSVNPNEYIEVGTFTLDEKDNSVSYNFTNDINILKQYWYVLEPGDANGFWLAAKQSANGTQSGTMNVSIDGNAIAFGIPPVTQDGKLLMPFNQFCAAYGANTGEIIENKNIPLTTLDGNEYCDIESVLFNIGARMNYDEPSNTYQIYSRTRIDQNAETAGSYLMELVQKKKAVVLYKPTVKTNGEKKPFKVVSILGDGYLDIQDGNPVIVDELEIPSDFGHLLVSEAAKMNFDTGKYVFGYFLDDKNHVVTDPVVLSELQTITIANWEYEIFRDGLTLMDKNLLFFEKPKHFSGAALLEKWNNCIKTGYDAIQFNKTAEPYLDFMESSAATVFTQTLSPHAGVVKLLGAALSDIIQSTAIGFAVDAGMNTLTGKVKPVDLVYGMTITEHDIFLSQRERMKEIIEKTGNRYILTFNDAYEFLQGYYQLNATMKTLYTSCQVYEELIPESRKSVDGALVNLGQNVLLDKVLDFTIVSSFNNYIDSEEIGSIITDIASGVIDSSSLDYDEDPVIKFLSDMYADIKNEKMKLNYALYNNVTGSMSYAVVAY